MSLKPLLFDCTKKSAKKLITTKAQQSSIRDTISRYSLRDLTENSPVARKGSLSLNLTKRWYPLFLRIDGNQNKISKNNNVFLYLVDIPGNMWAGLSEGEHKSELEIKTQRLFHGIVVRELAADVITLD